MTYGLRIRNDAGEIQIDDQWKTLRVRESGSVVLGGVRRLLALSQENRNLWYSKAADADAAEALAAEYGAKWQAAVQRAEAAGAEAEGARKIAGDYCDLFEAAEAKLDAVRAAVGRIAVGPVVPNSDRPVRVLHMYEDNWQALVAALADEPEAPVQHQEYGP